MLVASDRCSVESGVSSSSSVIPIAPFMGVRISWLMLARNWLLRRVASSAAANAFANAAFFSFSRRASGNQSWIQESTAILIGALAIFCSHGGRWASRDYTAPRLN
jgi:hypothetical protein